jgi:nitrite reductase/ring-hydroxylating ferredoxin subunit
MSGQGFHTPCAACAETDGRRDFLKHAAALVAGALVGVAGGGAQASALKVALGQPISKSGKELTYPLPVADGATVDRDNDVVIARIQNTVVALSIKCPHSGGELRWKPPVNRFECSRHDSRFEPPGVHISGRAKRNMDRFALKRTSDTVVVNAAQPIRSDTQQAQWGAAALTL